jgi:2-hydroxy-3-oxopropionate reductase
MGGSSALPTVGVVGLGNMGRPMTLNLLATRAAEVVVYGRDAAKLAPLEAAGARIARTPRDLAARADIVLSMLPDLPELRALLDGDTGLIAGADHPLTLVIGSTSSPDGVRALAGELAATTAGRMRVLDAPVSGGPEGAGAGTLAIMCGGEPETFARVRGVLETMGTPVLLGPLGSGEVAKACNQLIVAATISALGEATVIAERSGLDVAALLELFGSGYADSRILSTRKRRLVDKDYSVLAPAKFLVKDLGFAREEARRTRTAALQLGALEQIFAGLVADGLGDADLSVVQEDAARRRTEAAGLTDDRS